MAVPDGWTLSVDCVGPIKDGLSEFGPQVKYALVGVLVVPDVVGNLKAFFQDDEAAPEVPVEEDAFAVEAEEEADDGVRNEMARWEEIVRKEKVEGGKVFEVPFMVPLPSKAAPVVLDGITEILTKVKAMGLCVRRVHSDRGREFVNTAMKRYCSHRGLIRTTTSADDFKMNGRCEGMVGRLKAATRTLVAASGFGTDHWAFAMRHVVARAQSDLLRQLGVKQPTLPPFATRVYVKRRSWTARYHEWEEKVVPATILCPSADVSRGFLVKTEEGSYLTTMVAVENVKEATGEFEVPEEHAAPALVPVVAPKVRVRGKQRVASLQETAEEKEDEAMAAKFLEAGNFSVQALEDIVCQLRLRDQTRPLRPKTMVNVVSDAAVHNFGMFRHGGVTGLTSSLRRRPSVVRFINEVLRRILPPEATYTTVSINYNTPLAVHADCHNDLAAKNYVIGCGDYVGGDVWVALDPHEQARFPVAWKQFNGRWLQGQLHPVYHQVASFSPAKPHSPTSWEGFRVSIAAYTVGRHQAASGETHDQLKSAGFPVPSLVRARPEGGDGNHGGAPSVYNFSVAGTSGKAEAGTTERASSWTGRTRACVCKGYEMDPSLCTCRVAQNEVQQFYIGDFAPLSDGEVEAVEAPGLHADSVRALRHPGSGGDGHCSDLPADSVRALRHPGSGGDGRCSDLPADSVRALRHPGSGGDGHCSDLRADSVRAVRHPGPGGDSLDGAADIDGPVGSDGFEGYVVASAVRVLAPVHEEDGDGGNIVQWEMVIAEEKLGPCDAEGCDSLEQLRMYLLMVDHEERDALSLEIEGGEELGTQHRLHRLTGQVRELEMALERLEGLFDDGGEHSGGWDRIASAREEEDEAPLHTKSIPLEEVPRNLPVWVPSMRSEYQSLTLENSAVSPFTQEELDAWDREGKEYDLVPGKTVHSKKAFSGRLKTRAVVCGNYIADSYSKAEKFASGADGVLVRCCLRVCARRSWDIGALDIRTAFLLAPLLYREARPTIVRVPRVFLEAQICSEKYWRVDRAMHGLCTSPRSWSTYRDTTMKEMRGRFRGKIVCFKQSRADESLWFILLLPSEGDATDGGDEADCAHGLLLVYVDDILIAAISSLARVVSAMFQEKWRCSEPEWASVAGEVKFNGFEIKAVEDGLEIHQDSYVTDLLSRRASVTGQDDVPAPPMAKFAAITPVENQSPDKVREAQAIAGELQWLCGRCRPELTYGVNLMAQAISRSPEEAIERGHQLIKFLRRYPTGGLFFPKEVPQFTGSRTPRTSPILESFTDASFAPDGSRSQQSVQIYLDGSLVAWTSTRQAFVTMSTAESELVCVCEGVTALKSLEGLVAELFFHCVEDTEKVKKVVYTDSQAALSVCQSAAGTWRTRHLRIRGSLLRELLDTPSWLAFHIEGNLMVSDIGTKGLAADRFFFLMNLMGLSRPVRSSTSSATRSPEQIKKLVAALMLMALIPLAEAAPSTEIVVQSSAVKVASENGARSDYQLLAMFMAVIVVWELVKGVVRWGMSRCFAARTKPAVLEESESSDSAAEDPPVAPVLRERRHRVPVLQRDGQVIRKVVFTQNGKCVHAHKQCQTLNVSQEFIERKLCTVCCKIK